MEDLLFNLWYKKTIRIFSSDGGKFCKSYVGRYDYSCLDKFHLNMSVIRNVTDNELKKEIFHLIYKGNIEEVLYLIKYNYNTIRNKQEKKKLKNLYDYIKGNIKEILDILRLYEDERILDKDKNIGIQESVNRRVITNRMKNRGMSWSINGANNLANILCYTYSDIKIKKDLI